MDIKFCEKLCISKSIIHDCIEIYPSHPKGYRNSPHVPVLRGVHHCPHCLCAPCVITHPPDFLFGACSPHPANDGKRRRLYKMFWRLLKDLRLWNDDEYLERKERRTTIYDQREIIPTCVIIVSFICNNIISLFTYIRIYIRSSFIHLYM